MTTIGRAKRKQRVVITYKCTNCHTSNKTENPPSDSMLHCSKCGFVTVQYVNAAMVRDYGNDV
jgi:DNA-directed RNA polymerase subunit RPC12/RpoP